MTAPTYRIATDADGQLCVWMDGATPDLPIPLVRRCDVSAETWPLIVAGVQALSESGDR